MREFFWLVIAIILFVLYFVWAGAIVAANALLAYFTRPEWLWLGVPVGIILFAVGTVGIFKLFGLAWDKADA